MTSAKFYEKLEDGFATFTDPKASEFTRRGPLLEDLHRDYAHARKWAKWAQDEENKAAWAKIRDELNALYKMAWALNNNPKSVVRE